jgi:putative membrane protein
VALVLRNGVSSVVTEGANERPTQLDLAEDRTILASERTFAGWVRTSLGCFAIGLGFQALFNKMQPDWVPKAIASAFLLLAATVICLAARRAGAVIRRLSPHIVVGARRMNLDIIAAAVSIGAASLAMAIWLLPLSA